jgi:signal transduction histidine kinase
MPGTSLSEVVKMRVANGLYAGESPDEYIAERLKWGEDRVKHAVIIHELSDGRSIRISRQQLTGDSWVATHEDITERIRMERLKNEFVSVVSHELRTPLTSLIGSLRLVNSGLLGSMPEKAEVLLDIAYRNAERLKVLVDDILDMEKINSESMEFKFAPIEVVALACQIIEENVAFGAEFGISFRLEQDVQAAHVSADENKILQVLANLLSNAAKFSQPGSEVILRISRESGKIRYAVIDSGCGIPEDQQSKLFERFFQVDGSDKRSKRGTGLGLAIVKAIVEEHGSQIQIESEVGKGSTFFFDLEEVDAPSEIKSNPVETANTAVA